MEENKMAWAVMQQEKNVLVTQVKCLYKVRNDLWEVVDLYRTLIFPDQIKKPQYRVKDSLLFKTENEAIVAAEKLAPKNHNNKGGHNN
jgi:hypothetical protein